MNAWVTSANIRKWLVRSVESGKCYKSLTLSLPVTKTLQFMYILPPLCARPGWVKASNGSGQDFRRRRVRDYGFLYGRSKRRRANMAKRVARLKVWFDEEGDFLEVTFAKRKGSFRSIGPDIFERVDAKGKRYRFCDFQLSKTRPENSGNSSGGSEARHRSMITERTQGGLWRSSNDANHHPACRPFSMIC